MWRISNPILPARYAILISRLQSAPVYWRNELRVGPLVAHHQTVFVTAVHQQSSLSSRKLSTNINNNNIITTKPKRIIVHQPSSPLPVLRSPRITTTCRLLTRFTSVNSIINRNTVATIPSPGKFKKKKTNQQNPNSNWEFSKFKTEKRIFIFILFFFLYNR